MEAEDLQDTLDALIATLRVTLRTELSSIWLPIQFGAIAVAALAAWGCAALIRRKFDLVSATMGWPAYLRAVVRALVDNFGVLAFMVIIGVIRIGDPYLGRRIRAPTSSASPAISPPPGW